MKTILAAAAALLMTATGAHAQLYTQNFFTNQNGFTGGTAAVTASGDRYLQLANSEQTIFSFNTTGYTGLTLTFNLYGIQSLDGNGPDGGGPDNFLIYINGAATPTYNINIANYASGTNTQSFNGNLSQSGVGNTYAPFTGAIARGTLGYGTGPFGDSTYALTFALPDNFTSVRFVGATNEGRSDPNGGTSGNEAYGIDNVVLSGTAVTAGVPEPTTWATIIVGFGLMGGAIRRRRADVAFAAA